MSKHVYSSSRYSTRAQTLREAGFSVLIAGRNNWHLYTYYHGGSVHTIPRHDVYIRALGTVGNTQVATFCSMGTAWGGARPTVIGLGKDAAIYKNLQTEPFATRAGMEVARTWNSKARVLLWGSV